MYKVLSILVYSLLDNKYDSILHYLLVAAEYHDWFNQCPLEGLIEANQVCKVAHILLLMIDVVVKMGTLTAKCDWLCFWKSFCLELVAFFWYACGSHYDNHFNSRGGYPNWGGHGMSFDSWNHISGGGSYLNSSGHGMILGSGNFSGGGVIRGKSTCSFYLLDCGPIHEP